MLPVTYNVVGVADRTISCHSTIFLQNFFDGSVRRQYNHGYVGELEAENFTVLASQSSEANGSTHEISG